MNSVEISFKQDSYGISITLPEHDIPSLPKEIYCKMLTLLKGIQGELKAEEPAIKEAPNKAITEQQTKRDEFKIRERIPNNVVDVSTLDVKQAITEKALVRCPKCGQAHALIVHSGNNTYFMERNFKEDDFRIIFHFDSSNENELAGVCYKEDMDKLAYFNDLQDIKELSNDDFVLDNDTEIFCPVCHTSNAFVSWKIAYEHPLDYFETEHLCDVCGGEKLEKWIKKKHVYLCDSCGYQTEFDEG